MSDTYTWDAWVGERITRMESADELLHIQIEDGRGITINLNNGGISYWMNTEKHAKVGL